MFLKILYNITLSTLALVMAMPTAAILVTWNTVPGEQLYPLKRGLENAVLFVVSPSYRARSNLQINLIDRRLYEVKRTLKQKSSAALPELTHQAIEASTEIQDTNRTDIQEKTSDMLSEKILNAQQELEVEKKDLETDPDPSLTPVIFEINTTKIKLDKVLEDLEE